MRQCAILMTALLLAFAAVLHSAVAANGADWPERPVKLVVPFAAGGNIDAMARLAGQRLGEALGQQFVVENRVGGTGSIGTDAVVRAAPDGYTLLWASTSLIAIFPAMSKVKYDPVKDLVPIALFQIAPQVLVVSAKFPANSVSELIAAAKAAPGKLSYAGGGGQGSTSNLLMALFVRRAGVEMTGVTYRGTAQGLMDVIAGHVPTMFVPIGEALPQSREGLIRMLAVSGASRSHEAPAVPTLAESGFPGFDSVSWTGLMGPVGLPGEIVARLSGELAKALAEPAFVAHMQQGGVDAAPDASPAYFAGFITREIVLWADAVRAAGLAQQ